MRSGATLGWIGVAVAVGGWWFARRADDRIATVAVLCVVAAAALARGSAAAAWLDRAESQVRDDRPYWVHARLLDHPGREGDAPAVMARIERAEPSLPSALRARIRLPAGCDAEAGDVVEALVMLERPREAGNPGGFSPRAAARAMGCAAVGRALTAQRAATVASIGRATIVRWRRAIERVLATGLSENARELAVPLVVGDRSGVSIETSVRLQAAGLTHLLALSGLHVTWLAGVARGMAAVAGGGIGGRAIAGAACALFYVAIAGPLPSLLRAACTELGMTWARLRGRAIDPVQALALSALVLILVAPGWVDDLGFQLSCTATLGIVTVGRALERSLAEDAIGRGRHGVDRRRAVLRAVLAVLVPTAAAQLLVLPLLLARFHALPWTALATNLIAVPVCAWLLAAAWLAIALEWLAPGTGAWALAACEALSDLLQVIARGPQHVPLALLPTGSQAGPVILAAVGAALLALGAIGPRPLDQRHLPLSRGRSAALAGGAFASLLSIILVVTTPSMRPEPGRWWLIVLDVGQGDAIAIASPRGWWLVDAGPRSARVDLGQRAVLPFLRWAGVRRLEAVVLTHDHGDHTGGAEAVCAGIPVVRTIAAVPLPGWPGPAVRFRAEAVARGDTLPLAPRAVVLWPPRQARVQGDNAASLVLEVGEGEGRALLAADVDSTIEDSLRLAPRVAVLKVAHHGAGSSSGGRFVRSLAPRHAIVSCGRRNPFGHPHPGALARLAAAGAVIERTDRSGARWFELSAETTRAVPWRRDIHERATPRGDRNEPLGHPLRSAAHRLGPLARPGTHW
jgi:competence protein ComEC